MANDRVAKRFIGAVEDEWQLYSDNSTDYSLGAPIGFGASSIVYAAVFHPSTQASPTPCALKVLDLDSLPPHSLSLLQRETQLMSLSKHPNVLRVRGTWMDGHKLYIALRLMNKGSAADVMRYGWPGGMEEEVVRCILKQALEGLNYLHINGFIHRDIKAANLLIDDDGTVLLGDLGVAASLAEDGLDASKMNSHKPRVVGFDPALPIPHSRPKYGKRASFVGTPCWMAPELIQGKHYDSSADIWSFGITALELSQGRPPRSREAPQKVLLQTVQDAPPSLDREGGPHKYSRAFQDIVQSCLNKDPSKRPTAADLLQTPFFRSAKKKSYLVPTILSGLPPLTQRQESRRRQPASLLTHGSIDSWDFNASIAGSARSVRSGGPGGPVSPTASIHRRAHPLEIGVGVFELEAEVEQGVTVKLAGGREERRSHSWDENVVSLPEEATPNGSEQVNSSNMSLLPPASPSFPSSTPSSSPSPHPSPIGQAVSPGPYPPDSYEANVTASVPARKAVAISQRARSSTPPSSSPPSSSSPRATLPFMPSSFAPPPSLWRKLTRRDSVREREKEDDGERRRGFLARTTSRTAQAVGKLITD